jgi:hypothetical protein
MVRWFTINLKDNYHDTRKEKAGNDGASRQLGIRREYSPKSLG